MKWKVVFALLFVFWSIQPTFAQKANKKIKISGAVVDANRKPVANVMILVDQVKTGIVTNQNGLYSVKVPPAAKTITAFSLLNGIKEVDINGQTTLNIILDGAQTKPVEPVKKDDEIVDDGYSTTRNDRVLNTTKGSESEKTKTKAYTNIYEMISREVPGVQVNGTSVRIQSSPGSFYSGTEPLFIVDGVSVTQISDINPSDVASIEVLKGVATSIYGANGANGVLVIKLKK